MTQPRERQVAIEDTPYYHIVSRCVRRTYLCGTDNHTGKSFEHRRLWIEDRIRLLSSIFTIDICAYAVMSNHYHLVIKLNPEEANGWAMDDVLERWSHLYSGPLLVRKYMKGEKLSVAEYKTVENFTSVYRKRLTDLSWFMKCLNEPVSRQANKEDGCTGHFWEGRFKSQALLTEDALLSCMAYVDLNPVHAAIAETPETSDHTSIKERVAPTFDLAAAIRRQSELEALNHFSLPLKSLLHFECSAKQVDQFEILFDFEDYLALVDYTGRVIDPKKRGHISNHLPDILQRLNTSQDSWMEQATHFEKHYQKRHSKRCIKAA